MIPYELKLKSVLVWAIICLSGISGLAAPTTNSIVISGYLERLTGSVVEDGPYSASMGIKVGGSVISTCVYSGSIQVSRGYFSKEISCPATALNAGTGTITAVVNVVINAVTESFEVSAYPVPTALVASIANSVADQTITNAMVSNTAAISLSKLSSSGAAAGDLMTMVSGTWTPQALGTLNLPTTSGNNTFSGSQTFSGSGTALTVNNAASIGGGLTVSSGGTLIGTTTAAAGNGLTIGPAASTSGSPSLLSVVGPAHTGLTASTEAPDINFNLARTVTFSTGNITTQRAVRIQAPTYAFPSSSTITNAVTLSISGAPTAGTNALITNPSALVVESGYVGINKLNPSTSLDVKGEFRLSGSTSGYVGFAPASAAGATTYTLPTADGATGSALVTNGSGTLSWSPMQSSALTNTYVWVGNGSNVAVARNLKISDIFSNGTGAFLGASGAAPLDNH